MTRKEASEKICPLINNLCKVEKCMAWKDTKTKDIYVLEYEIKTACVCAKTVNSDRMCWECGTVPTTARGGYLISDKYGTNKDLEEDKKEGYCVHFGDIKPIEYEEDEDEDGVER